MRIFVTGASGFIGSALVEELVGAGHEVAGLTRSDHGAASVERRGATVVRGELDDLEVLRRAASDADGVAHLAYRHGSPTEQAVASDRAAIEALGEALAGTGRRLVMTTGTLGLSPGRVGIERNVPDEGSLAAGRGANERVALNLVDRSVGSVVVRLAPSIHERVKRGFLGGLIDVAREHDVSAYVADGSSRWPAANRRDIAVLYRLALEGAPAGSVLHGVAEEGIGTRQIAETIGRGLGLPIRSIAPDDADEHFGWLGGPMRLDQPASSELTRSLLGWEPTHLGLIEDLETGEFFATTDGSS